MIWRSLEREIAISVISLNHAYLNPIWLFFKDANKCQGIDKNGCRVKKHIDHGAKSSIFNRTFCALIF